MSKSVKDTEVISEDTFYTKCIELYTDKLSDLNNAINKYCFENIFNEASNNLKEKIKVLIYSELNSEEQDNEIYQYLKDNNLTDSLEYWAPNDFQNLVEKHKIIYEKLEYYLSCKTATFGISEQDISTNTTKSEKKKQTYTTCIYTNEDYSSRMCKKTVNAENEYNAFLIFIEGIEDIISQLMSTDTINPNDNVTNQIIENLKVINFDEVVIEYEGHWE